MSNTRQILARHGWCMTAATAISPEVEARSVYASSDPEGTGVLYQVPGDPEGVDALRESGVPLYCPILFGGCGRALRPHAQRKDRTRRNYFQHVDPCACEGVAGASAAHHYIQQEVARHLSRLGFETTYEESLRAYGIADIAVLGDDGAPVATVEVQVSSKVVEELEERDRLYRESVSQVTWLWGRDLSRAAAAFAEDNGFCLRVDVAPEGVVLHCQGHDGRIGEAFPLEEITYSVADGFGHPQIDHAIQRHAEYVEERRRRDDDVAGFLAQEKARAKKWISALESARDGEFTPWGPGELDSLMAQAPLGMRLRHSSTHLIGVLKVPDGGLTLTRHGVCPFNGDPLYVSREGEAAINSMSETGERVTLWVAAGRSSTEEIHIPAGLYPLAEKSARLEVPRSAAIIRTTPAVLSRRLEAPRKEADNWQAYRRGEVILVNEGCPWEDASLTRTGKRYYRFPDSKLLHYPTFEELAWGLKIITPHVDPRLLNCYEYAFLRFIRVAPDSDPGGSTWCATKSLTKAPTPPGFSNRKHDWDRKGGEEQVNRRASGDPAKVSIVAYEARAVLGYEEPGGWVMSDYERHRVPTVEVLTSEDSVRRIIARWP